MAMDAIFPLQNRVLRPKLEGFYRPRIKRSGPFWVLRAGESISSHQTWNDALKSALAYLRDLPRRGHGYD